MAIFLCCLKLLLTEGGAGLFAGTEHDLLAAGVHRDVLGHVVDETVDNCPTISFCIVVGYIVHGDGRQAGHVYVVVRLAELLTNRSSDSLSSLLLLLLGVLCVHLHYLDPAHNFPLTGL